MKYGIKSTGAYLPYRYLPKADISKAWGGKGGKGEKSVADVAVMGTLETGTATAQAIIYSTFAGCCFLCCQEFY